MNVQFVRIATLLIVGVVVIAGGIVAVLNPDTLSFEDYVRNVAIGAGLLGIGLGVDGASRP